MIKKIFLIAFTCLLFTSCGVKDSPEYNSQIDRDKIIHLV